MSHFSFSEVMGLNSNTEDSVQKLEKIKAQAQSQMLLLNQNNPFSDQFQLGQKIIQWVENPYYKKILSLLSAPEIYSFILKIQNHPNKRDLVIYFVLLNIILFITRWLLVVRQTHFLRRVWTSVWTFTLLVFIVFFIFPYYHFGEDYFIAAKKAYIILKVPL